MTSARVRVALHRLLKTLKIGVIVNFRLQYSALKNSATLHDYFIHEQKENSFYPKSRVSSTLFVQEREEQKGGKYLSTYERTVKLFWVVVLSLCRLS